MEITRTRSWAIPGSHQVYNFKTGWKSASVSRYTIGIQTRTQMFTN